MKRFLKNYLPALALGGLLVVLGSAAPGEAKAQCASGFCPFAQNNFALPDQSAAAGTSGFVDNTLNAGEVGSGGAGSGQSQLDKERQQAAQQCQAQTGPAGALQGLLGQVGSPTSLAGTLTQGLLNNLSKTTNNIVGQTLPNSIQNLIQTKLPQLIQQNIATQLPGYIGSRSPTQSLVQQGIRQIITQTLQNDLPRLLQNEFNQQLPPQLAQSFQNQIPQIIDQSNLPDQLASGVASTSQSINSSLPFGQSFTTDQQQQLSDGIIQGVKQNSVQAFNSSGAPQNIARNLSPLITQTLMPLLLSQLQPAILGNASNYVGGGGGQSFDSVLNSIMTGQGVPGIGGQVLQGLDLGGITKQTMAAAGNAVGSQVATGIRQVQISSALDAGGGQMTIGQLEKIPGGLGQLNMTDVPADLSTTVSYQDFAFNNPGDFGPAAEGVASAAESAGNTVSSGMSGITSSALSGIKGVAVNTGNALLGSIPNMVGGLLSGLPGGQYYAPFVQQILGNILAQFGVETDLGGLPVADQGVSSAIQEGNKIAGKTQGLTQQIQQTTDQTRSLIQQACTYEKQAYTENKNLTDWAYKYNPAVTKRAITATQQNAAAWQQFVQTGRKESGGNSNATGGTGNTINAGEVGNASDQNGYPLISQNPNDDAARAAAEGNARTIVQVNQSQNNNAAAVGQTLQLEQSSSPAQELAPTVAPGECDKLKDPNGLGAGSDYLDLQFRCLQPWNDPRGSTFMALDYRNQNVAAAIQNSRDEVQNGQGYKGVQVCGLWADQLAYDAGALSGSANPGHNCLRWITVLPGSDISNITKFYQTAQPTQVRDAKMIQDDAVNALTAQNQQNLINYYQPNAPRQEANVGQDPCPGTGPCPNTGWKAAGQTLTNGLGTGLSNAGNVFSNSMNNLVSQAFTGNFGGGGGYSNGGSAFNLGSLTSLTGLLGSVPINLPPPQINYFRYNDGKIEWSVSNTALCDATTDWSGTDINNGDHLPSPEGSVSLSVPAEHSDLNFGLTCYNLDGQSQVPANFIMPANQ